MEGQKRFKQQTTCCSCEKLLKNPKLLPCLHSYCSSCLEKVVHADEEIVCLKCFERHGICGGEGAASIPKDTLAEALIHLGKTGNTSGEVPCSSCEKGTAVAVNRCVDCGEFLCPECSGIHERLRQTRDHQLITLEESEETEVKEEIVHRPIHCDLHPDEELKYYCEQGKCKHVICRECTIVKHKNHKYIYMEDSPVIKELVESLESFSKKFESKIDKLTKAIDEVNGTFDLITGSIAGLKRSVSSTATEMVRAIRVAEEEMITEIDRVQSRKFHGLKRQVKELKTNLESFENSKSYTKNALKYLSGVELYLSKDPLSERSTALTKKRLHLTPIEDNNLKHIRMPRKEEKMARRSLGYLEVNGNSVINGCLRDINEMYPSKRNSPEVNGHLKGISVNVRGPGGEWLCPLKVERESSTGDFGAEFQTERAGIHDVVVSVDGVPVCDKPPQVLIGPAVQSIKQSQTPSSYSFGEGGRRLEDIKDVHGIAVDDNGNIVVTDTKYHRIQVFEMSGQFVSMFGRFGSDMGQFNSPHGVAINEKGHLVIADTENHRIQIFDNNGRYLKSIDCHGNNDEPFRPYGVAVDQHDYVIALDRELCKLRVYDDHDQIVLEFGGLGSNNGEFINPSYVAVNPDGHLLVSDMGNNRVQVFTASGVFLLTFGKTGSGDGEFRWPTGIAVKLNGDVVVADSCNNRIQTFRSDGSFLSCYGASDADKALKSPEGVAVRDVVVLVADWGNSRVQVFGVEENVTT